MIMGLERLDRITTFTEEALFLTQRSRQTQLQRDSANNTSSSNHGSQRDKKNEEIKSGKSNGFGLPPKAPSTGTLNVRQNSIEGEKFESSLISDNQVIPPVDLQYASNAICFCILFVFFLQLQLTMSSIQESKFILKFSDVSTFIF